MEPLQACPFCGCDRLRVVRRALRVYGPRFSSPRYTVTKCGACGLAFTNPRPAAGSMKLFYEHYFDGYMNADATIYARRAQDVVARTGMSRGRALDLGCGTGQFLAGLKNLGWDTLGVEPDASAREHAVNRYQLDVRQGSLSALLDHEPGWFDVITMWHVLEHVADPLGTLSRCAALLRAGGWLIVEVPDYGSLQSSLFRNSWFPLQLPEHLYHYSSRTLGYALGQSGFASVRVTPQFNNAGWGTSARLKLSELKHRMVRNTGPHDDRQGPTAVTNTTAPASNIRAEHLDPIAKLERFLNHAGYAWIEAGLLGFRSGTTHLRADGRKV